MTDEAGTNPPRSFSRVDARLPVRVRVLGHDEAERLAERINLEPSYTERLAATDPDRRGRGEGSWEHTALATVLDRLDRLERCLEQIARHLGVDLSDTEGWIEAETTNLSGSGMGIRAASRIQEGTLLEVEVTLLGDPTAFVRTVGRVASLVLPDGDDLPVGRFQLGIAFEAIHRDDREAIVRYTFRLQRALLRERHDPQPT